MKKVKNFLNLFFLLFLITGCGSNSEKEVVADLEKKMDSNHSYYLEGVLEIVNDENVYNYNVEVAYKKDDYYKDYLVKLEDGTEEWFEESDIKKIK